jgi:lycopene cyclase domain-containing protein
MWLYAILLLASIVIPFTLSFDSKLRFWKKWNVVLPAIFIVAAIYILFDILFTRQGVWGFNPLYHLDLVLWGLPMEEYLFFLVVPYASLFIHYALFLYFPNAHLPVHIARLVTLTLIAIVVFILIFNSGKAYTVYAFGALLLALLVSFTGKKDVLQKFYSSFLIILLPFVIINGILTGSLIEQEVVWYNQAENLGLRIFTIPIEDFAYGFSMIYFNLLIINLLEKKNVLKHA